MRSAEEIARHLIELTQQRGWTEASALRLFPGTPMFQVVWSCVEDRRTKPTDPPPRKKSVNELSAEISTFLFAGYVPVATLARYDFDFYRATLSTSLYPEYEKDPEVQSFLTEWTSDLVRTLGERGSIITKAQ